MNRPRILFLIFLISLSLIILAGCNKEKAEAIKVAASQFRMEAVSALEQIKYLFEQSVSLPLENQNDRIEKIALDLDNSDQIGAAELSFLITEDNVAQPALNQITREFKALETQYYQFESMFRSLPEGSFFAKDAVKKSEKHAINLTMQFINFGKFLQNYDVQFTARRTVILDRILKYKSIADDSLRKTYLRLAAREIIDLRTDENTAKKEAITKCLKAVEAGKLVAELIRDYDRMSVKDVLVTTKNVLDYISKITSNHEDVVSLRNRFDSIEKAIQQDPYWQILLDVEIPTKREDKIDG